MNPSAIKQADHLFYARHPELARRPLSMNPSDRNLRREWTEIYRNADAADKKGFRACDIGGVVQPCPQAAAVAPVAAPVAPASPVIVTPPPSCTIEVHANQLSPLGYYHMFIVFTNAAGEKYYLRGGPSSGGGGTSRSSGEMSGGSSNASSNSSSGSGSNSSASSDSSADTGTGPFGNIVTEYGKYEPGTIDWDPTAKAITVKNDSDACDLYATLMAQMDSITASHTRYNPLGPNSNSTVFTALKNVGITPATPADVWAPGKDIPITVKTP